VVKSTRIMKIVLIIFTVWCAALSLLNFFEIIKSPVWGTKWFWMFFFIIVFIAITFVVCFYISKFLTRLPDKYRTVFICLIIFSIAFISHFIYMLIINTPQYTDFNKFYKATMSLVSGDRTYISGYYWHILSYQLGFPIFMAIIVKIFGFTSANALVIVNLLFASGSAVFIYLISKRFIKECAAIFSALIYLLLPMTFDLGAMLTNQTLAMFLTLAGIYVIGRNWPSKPAYAVLGGVLLALANVSRQESIVFISAIIVMAIICIKRGIIKSNNGHNFKIILNSAIIAVSFSLCCLLISQLCILTKVDPYGLTNNFPLYKFAVGLNMRTGGQYSAKDRYGVRTDERNAIALRIIKERLSVGIPKLTGLAFSKTRTLWTNYKNHYWSFRTTKKNDVIINVGLFKMPAVDFENTFNWYETFLLFLIFAACTFSGILLYKRKELQGIVMTMILAFMSFSVIYMLIEVQNRYHYIMLPFILIFTVFFTEKIIFQKHEKKISRNDS